MITGSYSDTEIEYIKFNSFDKTAKEMANHLNRCVKSVMAKRNKLGYTQEVVNDYNIKKECKCLCDKNGYSFIAIEIKRTKSRKRNIIVYFEYQGRIVSQNLKGLRANMTPKSVIFEDSFKNSVGNGGGIYKFWILDKCVYIGKSKNLYERLLQHLKNPERSHVSAVIDCITKIEISKMGQSDMNIIEPYLIALYKPSLNKDCIPDDLPSFVISEPVFKELTGWKLTPPPED